MVINLINRTDEQERAALVNLNWMVVFVFARNLTKSVGMKLFFIVFASIVILVVAIGSISYSISKDVIQTKVAEASLQTINQASRRLDNLFSSFEDLSNQVLGSSDIKLLLYNYYSAPEGSFNKQEVQRKLQNQLFNLLNNNTMYAISMVDKNGKLVATTGRPPKESVADTDWFKKVSAKAEGEPVWLETRKNGFFGSHGLKSFALGRYIQDISTGGTNNTVLLFEYKFSVFQSEMNDVRMGETGFADIISADKKFVYDQDEERVESDSSLSVALNEARYSDFVVDSQGNRQLVVYQQSVKTGWYVLGEVPLKELLLESQKISRLTIVMSILAALVACGIGYLVIRTVARPLVEIRNLMKEGERGNLAVRSSIRSQDEIGQLAQSFNQMMGHITALVQKTNDSAQQVLATSSELTEASRRTSHSANEIAEATEEIAAGAATLAVEAERGSDITQIIGSQIKNVIEVNVRMEHSASEVQEVSVHGIDYMSELITKTNSTEEMTRSMIEKVNKLNESTQAIRKILDLMKGMTQQTNILSLNAAIEASRAGNAGKGFMVVADEIRKLADQSKQSIDVVSQITDTIQSEMDETVSVLTTAYPLFREQITSVKEADLIFKQVQQTMNNFIQNLSNASSSIQELEKTQFAFNEAMGNVSAVAEQSSATSQEVASLSIEQKTISEGLVRLSDHLEGLSNTLKDSLSKFQV